MPSASAASQGLDQWVQHEGALDLLVAAPQLLLEALLNLHVPEVSLPAAHGSVAGLLGHMEWQASPLCAVHRRATVRMQPPLHIMSMAPGKYQRQHAQHVCAVHCPPFLQEHVSLPAPQRWPPDTACPSQLQAWQACAPGPDMLGAVEASAAPKATSMSQASHLGPPRGRF